jgi:hypothetical protein
MAAEDLIVHGGSVDRGIADQWSQGGEILRRLGLRQLGPLVGRRKNPAPAVGCEFPSARRLSSAKSTKGGAAAGEPCLCAREKSAGKPLVTASCRRERAEPVGWLATARS